jgi:hypothetical protein
MRQEGFDVLPEAKSLGEALKLEFFEADRFS